MKGIKIEKKNILLFIIIFSFVIFISVGTYALWMWQSSVNKNVTFTTAGLDDYIVYDEGDSSFVGNFQPSDSYCDGISNTVSFLKTKEANNSNLVATINMDINSIGDNIKNSDYVKWAVTAGNSSSCTSNVLASGTFKNIAADTTIKLLDGIEIGIFEKSDGTLVTKSEANQLLNKNSANYNTNLQHFYNVANTKNNMFTIWIWIDESGTDLSKLSGETIDTNIWTHINDILDDSNIDNSYKESILNGADPELVTGMIPVTISTDGTVTTADTTTQWYSYENKQWANAVLVKKDATSGVTGSKSRQYYMEHPGETVLESDILAYYVWIPRYKYTFPNANGSPELISIIFENKDTDKSIPSTGKASGTNYYTHPAFTFGTNNELNGIWVGKFETSHSTLSSSGSNDNLSCTSEACANADGLIIKPNVASLRRNSVSNMFYSSRFMSTTNNSFGLDGTTTNTHMLKNSEWGAIAYLSHSQYGKGNVEITINNNSNFITGAGNGTTYFSPVTGTYTHPQSTTGNITGVFDISGGAHEYVMGNYDKYNRNFETLPEEKYYDIYSTSTTSTASCTLAECGGHALHETSGWYSDYNSFVYYAYPWFARGGRFDAGSTAGAFNLDRGDGGANAYYGFRSVAIKEV